LLFIWIISKVTLLTFKPLLFSKYAYVKRHLCTQELVGQKFDLGEGGWWGIVKHI
jgi:hypothetical protein